MASNPATTTTNPAVRAVEQGEAAGSSDWDLAFRRIMALTAQNPQKFAAQPQANRFEAILEAFVPSRSNPTHVKVLALVNALVQSKAIRPDEAGAMYNAMLQRVARYNSTNTQANLSRLVQDVREAVSTKERSSNAPSLGSMVTLNAFFSSLPANVPRGQSDYLAFISALRLLVSEVPQTDVYQAGPNYFFSTSRHGQQTVNLTTAFKNLEPLWGVKAPITDRSAISSILTPNTRLLLLVVAPFTEAVNFDKSTYLGHLLTLYREAIGSTAVDETTFNEITSVSRALGQEDTQNLTATLNFLLTNKPKRVPTHHFLSEDEERVLRYIQQSVSLFLMQDGVSASEALDLASANLAPSYYAAHRDFINNLLDYMRRALQVAPDYFMNIVMNANWVPPEGFYTGEFDFPEEQEAQPWASFNSADYNSVLGKIKDYNSSRGSSPSSSLRSDSMDLDMFYNNSDSDEPRSLSEYGAAAPRSRAPSRASSKGSLRRLLSLSPRPALRVSPTAYTNYLYNTEREFAPKIKNENSLDSLTSLLDTAWTPHRQGTSQYRLPTVTIKKEENSDDSFSGTGINPFLHLRPKGKIY